jgi:hypothetical protein
VGGGRKLKIHTFHPLIGNIRQPMNPSDLIEGLGVSLILVEDCSICLDEELLLLGVAWDTGQLGDVEPDSNGALGRFQVCKSGSQL